MNDNDTKLLEEAYNNTSSNYSATFEEWLDDAEAEGLSKEEIDRYYDLLKDAFTSGYQSAETDSRKHRDAIRRSGAGKHGW